MSTSEGGAQDAGLASSALADSGGPQMAQAHHLKFARSHDEKPSSSLHRDIAMTLSRDVEKMITQAKHDSESKVKTELTSIRSEIEAVTKKIESYFAMGANLQKEKSNLPASDIVDKRTLTEFVQKIEQRWMMEMRSLKQELHQTILAHNHNADLMKHLKDAMDQIRMQLDERNLPQNEQWMRCMPRIDEFLRQSTQRDRQLQSITPKLDSLLLRVESLESQILSLPPAPFPGSGVGGPPSGLGALGGGRVPLEAGPSGWGALKDPPSSVAPYHMLNRWTQQDGPGQAAREQHKETRKEQMQQQQLQQQQAEKDKKEEKEKRGDLRAAAPVFVPKSSEGPSSQNGSSEKGKSTRKMSSPQQPGPPSSQQQPIQLQQPAPMDKMESVGAPPGLPPPPGLSMEPQSM